MNDSLWISHRKIVRIIAIGKSDAYQAYLTIKIQTLKRRASPNYVDGTMGAVSAASPE